MITLEPKDYPYQIQQQLDWLRELYSWQLFCGEMIHLSECLFSYMKGPRSCEFARAWKDQDPELAMYQWFACIQKLYNIEYSKTLTAGLV